MSESIKKKISKQIGRVVQVELFSQGLFPFIFSLIQAEKRPLKSGKGRNLSQVQRLFKPQLRGQFKKNGDFSFFSKKPIFLMGVPMEMIILLSSLVLIAMGGYLFTSIILKQSDDQDILAWAEGNEPVKSKSKFIQFSRPLVHNFALSHARKIKRPKYRQSIEKKLLTAGLNRELNVDEFIGLQILWGIGFPIIFVILNFGLGLGFPYFVALLISGVGIYFPHAYCNSSKKKREIAIRSDLPLFVDILALSTEAGLDFIGAIQRITDKAPKNNVLAGELLIVLKDLRLGQTRKEALTSLDKRVDMPEMKSVVAVIRDAGETGASIAEALKSKSKQMRYERFAKAEEMGAKASQKILIPMMVFILPAIFIIVFAPAVFQFMGESINVRAHQSTKQSNTG